MAEQLTLNQLVGSSSLPRLTSIPNTQEPVRIARAGLLNLGEAGSAAVLVERGG